MGIPIQLHNNKDLTMLELILCFEDLGCLKIYQGLHPLKDLWIIICYIINAA